jgi:hypothetical protein
LKDVKVSHKELILLPYKERYHKNHICYQEIWCSNQKTKVLVCYDFQFGILDEKEDVMFVTKLELFSIGTIKIPIHIESIFKPICILNHNIAKLVPKPHVEPRCVLAINLVIPPNIVKHHLL